MQNVTEHFDGSGFKVFANMIASNPKVQVWAIPAKTGGSRAFCDRMNAWAQSQGQPGLGYIFWKEEDGKIGGSGPLAKNIGEERTEAVRTQLGSKPAMPASSWRASRPSSTSLPVKPAPASVRI